MGHDCLASQLSARTFLRLATTVLADGWKAPARYLILLFGRATPVLLSSLDSAKVTAELHPDLFASPVGAGGRELDAFVAEAFRPPLQSRKHPFGAEGAEICRTSFLEEVPYEALTWPRLGISGSEGSSLIDNAALVTIWSGPLPSLSKLRCPRLIFSTAQDGYNLHALAHRCEEFSREFTSDVPMLFFLSTDTCGVLGGYSPLLWRSTGTGWVQRHERFQEAFVFALPRKSLPGLASFGSGTDPARTVVPMTKYHWTGANDFLFTLSDSGILFGGDSPALGIDADLLHGTTSQCASFGSHPLRAPGAGAGCPTPNHASIACPHVTTDASAIETSIDFMVQGLEVFALVEDS